MPLISSLKRQNNTSIHSDQILDTPSEAGFRHVLRFSVPDTDTLSFDPAQTTLQIRFKPYTYNALTHATLSARRQSADGFVIVRLPAPRRIVLFDHSKSNKLINIHRVDGDVVSDKATLTNIQPNVPAKPTFTHPQMVLKAKSLASDTIVDGDMMDGGDTLIQPDDVPVEAGILAPVDGVFMAGDKPFLDVNLAVGLADNTSLSTDDLTKVQVRSVPTSLRLSVAPLDDYNNPFIFWQSSGEHEYGELAVAGTALADALMRLLDTLDEPPVEFAILVESGAECQYAIEAVHIQPRGVVSRFGDHDKVVLKPDGSNKTQTAKFTLPANPTVVHATMRVIETLDTMNPIHGDTSPIENYPYGLRLASGETAAVRINLEEAIRLQELRVGLLSLSRKSVLHVALQTDHDHVPSGQVLAEATIEPDTVALPEWAVVRFPATVTLSTAPYWLVLGARDGEVIWLADQEIGVNQVLRLNKNPNDGRWTAQTSLVDLSPAISLATTMPPTTTSDPTLQITIDGTIVTGVPVTDDTGAVIAHDYNLLPSLTGAEHDVIVHLQTYSRGLVTFKSLRVEYNI